MAGETSNRRIASQYDVSERAVRDHKANHLKGRMLKAVEQREEADIRIAIDVVGQLKAINGAALAVLKGARDAHDGELALKAIDRLLRQIELQAKLIGDLQQEGTTTITVNAEWIEIRSVVLSALAPYPDARQAVAGRLQMIEGGTSHAAD
ncbi:MAG: hypothetical protein M3457_02710 [Chloroflexota bacterium]|nr:hypothetical protein [Chloroflexota bacterium]